MTTPATLSSEILEAPEMRPRGSLLISETARRLLDEGVRQLIRQGYHGSGLKGLLASVGVPKGSFYHYFDSKDAFAGAVVRHYMAPFLDRLQQLNQESRWTGADLLRRYFEDLIQESRRLGFRDGCLLGNLMGEAGACTGPCTEMALREALEQYVDALATLIGRAQHDGSLSARTEARDLAEQLIDQWQGALLRAKFERTERPLRQCLQGLLGTELSPS